MTRPTVHKSWVEALAFEVALEYFTPEDLQLKFDLTPEKYQAITTMPAFRRAVNDYAREINDEGVAFRLRARKAAEDILDELHAMAFDQRLEAKDRLKAMEMMCRYAGFESQRQEDGSGVKLQIVTNLSMGGGGTTGQTYEIEVPYSPGEKREQLDE